MRMLTASAVACLAVVTLSAEQAAPQGGGEKLVRISGCVGGWPAKFYLTNATAADAAEKKGGKPAGTTGVVTNYELTARDGVSLAPHVGHRVELTGVITGMAKGGVEPGAEEKEVPDTAAARAAREKSKGLTAQFAVTAVKMVSPLCLQ